MKKYSLYSDGKLICTGLHPVKLAIYCVVTGILKRNLNFTVYGVGDYVSFEENNNKVQKVCQILDERIEKSDESLIVGLGFYMNLIKSLQDMDIFYKQIPTEFGQWSFVNGIVRAFNMKELE